MRKSACVICGKEIVTEHDKGRLPHRCQDHRWTKQVKTVVPEVSEAVATEYEVLL